MKEKKIGVITEAVKADNNMEYLDEVYDEWIRKAKNYLRLHRGYFDETASAGTRIINKYFKVNPNDNSVGVHNKTIEYFIDNDERYVIYLLFIDKLICDKAMNSISIARLLIRLLNARLSDDAGMIDFIKYDYIYNHDQKERISSKISDMVYKFDILRDEFVKHPFDALYTRKQLVYDYDEMKTYFRIKPDYSGYNSYCSNFMIFLNNLTQMSIFTNNLALFVFVNCYLTGKFSFLETLTGLALCQKNRYSNRPNTTIAYHKGERADKWFELMDEIYAEKTKEFQMKLKLETALERGEVEKIERKDLRVVNDVARALKVASSYVKREVLEETDDITHEGYIIYNLNDNTALFVTDDVDFDHNDYKKVWKKVEHNGKFITSSLSNISVFGNVNKAIVHIANSDIDLDAVKLCIKPLFSSTKDSKFKYFFSKYSK